MKATMNFDELKEGMRVKWGESEGRIVKLYPHYAWAEFKNTINVPENLYIDRENVQYIVPVEPEKGHKFETGMRVKYKHQLGTVEAVGKDCCFVRFDNAWGGLPCLFENEMLNELHIVDDKQEEIENIPQTSPSPAYYDVGGISVNDVIRAKLTPEEYAGWCKGNILKYTMRAKYKEDEQKDLKKAADYMRWLIESKEGKDDELHPRSF